MKNRSVVLFLTSIVIIFALIFLALPKDQVSAQKNEGPPTFSNTAPITINTATGATAPFAATNYPADISVSGMTGTISRVEFSLRGLSSGFLGDLDLLLVSPGGQKFIFLSDASVLSSSNPKDGVYKFADDAPTSIFQGNTFPPGSYKPTNINTGTDTFPAPAPAGPYSGTTFAGVFNGNMPNGVWSLYAVDDTMNSLGSRIDSGWELKLTTDGAPQTFANATAIGLEEAITRANPYSSDINVSGLSGVVTGMTVNLNGFSHDRPSDVDILLVNPNGRSIILMSDVGGTTSVNNLNFTFTAAATTFMPTPLISGTYRPSNNQSDEDFFPFAAPLPVYTTPAFDLTPLNGSNPNGDWKLFVVDDADGQAGMISGGWSLQFTTAPPPPSAVGCASAAFASSNFAVGSTPTNLAVGDFNNDSRPDLVATNQISNDISILINNGSGGFLPQTTATIGTGSNPYAVAVGLFNNDANQDLAVVNSNSNSVSILLGNGDGTFSAPTNFTTGASPISVAVGDFNNDSNQDLAIANFGGFFAGSISILNGNGNGGFSLPSTLRTSTQPAFVKVANLNNDTEPDLIVANFGANQVSIYFGTSAANGFAFNQVINGLQGPVSIELSDVVGNDNIPDIIVSYYTGNQVLAYRGLGNGIFNVSSSAGGFTTGANPISAVAGDFLGDNVNRIAAALSSSNKVAIQALPFGTEEYTIGDNPNGIVKADFNGDGRLDLATANFGSNNVSVLTNGCTTPSGNIYDFNGDRKTDIGIYRPSGGVWAVFGVSNVFYFGRDRDIITPADYNGDGRTDLGVYRPESGLWITTETVPFNLTTRAIHYLYFGVAEDIPMPADYDGDGKADIAVFRPSNGFWYIRKSSDNSFLATAFGQNGDRPVAADYDGDGKADIAVFRPSNGTWYIQGSQDGFFARVFGQQGDLTVQGDYDGDGKADVAVFRDGDWFVLRSSDNGFFGQTWGAATDKPVLGDYDGDGKFDLGVFRPSNGTWYILQSSNNALRAFTYGLGTDIPIPSAYVR